MKRKKRNLMKRRSSAFKKKRRKRSVKRKKKQHRPPLRLLRKAQARRHQHKQRVQPILEMLKSSLTLTIQMLKSSYQM